MNIQECEKLVNELLQKYSLDGWKLQWKKRLTNWSTAGACSNRKKLILLQPIYVEKNSIANVTNTILHEIAHALTPNHGHNKFWKRKAIEIGCIGSRTYSNEVIK
jgi:predicted SprT family Zn-dependent metalloprotease